MAASKVLVIGGGIGGMSSAIALRKIGVAVELVELDPDWRAYGAGLSISSPTMRAFAQLGVLPEVEKRGFCANDLDLCDPAGRTVATVPSPRVAGKQVYGNGGVMRPVLKDILSRATLAAGVRVRLGVSFTELRQNADAVRVEFTDGESGDFDLVIGADGLMSKTRETVFPDAPSPAYTGQGCWRAVFPRPPEVVRARFFVGLPYKVGCNPVSQDEMYMFLLENSVTKRWVSDQQLHDGLRALLANCGGVLAAMGETLNADSRIMFRPLEAVLLPRPWHRGRVVLLGDAVHATTPHLASGAGMAVEDALVLAEEVAQRPSVAAALEAFTARRYERCRGVVESSLRLGEIEQGRGTQEEHIQLMQKAMQALTAPI